jgi:hypothetical protein
MTQANVTAGGRKVERTNVFQGAELNEYITDSREKRTGLAGKRNFRLKHCQFYKLCLCSGRGSEFPLSEPQVAYRTAIGILLLWVEPRGCPFECLRCKFMCAVPHHSHPLFTTPACSRRSTFPFHFALEFFSLVDLIPLDISWSHPPGIAFLFLISACRGSSPLSLRHSQLPHPVSVQCYSSPTRNVWLWYSYSPILT